MSQPRHKRKRGLAAHNGQVVRVTRFLAGGDVLEYEAILELEIDGQGHIGRAILERLKFFQACAHVGAYELFLAAADVPIKGFPDWWKISGHYAEMSRHTRGRTYTRAVMDLLAVYNSG